MLGNDKAVISCLAGVDHAGVAGLVVLENEELVTQQIHLHNCLLNRHGLDGEGLGSDVELSFFLDVVVKVGRGDL